MDPRGNPCISYGHIASIRVLCGFCNRGVENSIFYAKIGKATSDQRSGCFDARIVAGVWRHEAQTRRPAGVDGPLRHSFSEASVI